MKSNYRNPYFNFEMQFPESWKLSYWDNRKNLKKYPEKNQISYDDLPDENNEAKHLFVSFRRKAERSAVFSNFIGIEAVYRKGEYNVASEYPVFNEQSYREARTLEIGEISVPSLYIESEVEDYVRYMNIIYWKVSDAIWLRGNVQGDCKDSYNESLDIFLNYRVLQK
jgi:hypothetical protein